MKNICSTVLVLALCTTLSAHAENLVGRTVSVADGDTITVLDGSNTQHKIRLAGIDAPERKQAFGTVSRQNLARLVFGKQVIVDWQKRDRYRRIIGKVIVNRTDVNLEQIKDGLAWHYKAYQREQMPVDRESYAAAENAARNAKLGLWSDAAPVAPWVFRHPVKGKK